MSAASPTAAPRRHAGRAGAPRCEWGTAPAAASPKHTWPPARRARAAAPASQSAAGWQESAHGRHFGDTHGDGPTAGPIPRPCPPPRHRPPGRPPRPPPSTATNGRWRDGASTTNHSMAILPAAHGWHRTPHTRDGGPPTSRVRTTPRRHADANGGDGPPRRRGHGLDGPDPTGRRFGPAGQLPPPPPPHPSPNPAPGAALFATLAGQGQTGVPA